MKPQDRHHHGFAFAHHLQTSRETAVLEGVAPATPAAVTVARAAARPPYVASSGPVTAGSVSDISAEADTIRVGRPHVSGRQAALPFATGCDIRAVSAQQLTSEELEELWCCYKKFVNCPRRSFLKTLGSADEVYMCRDKENGHLVGFHAFRIVIYSGDGRRTLIVFTLYGDLEREFRGRNVMQRIGIHLYLKMLIRFPLARIYWMFTASTFTSYVLLAHNFSEYWPHRHRQTPEWALRLMDIVMRNLNVHGWAPDAGVLKRSRRLRFTEGVVTGDRNVLNDPDVRWYAQCNPAQDEGHSLVCLCPMTAQNIFYMLTQMLKHRFRMRDRI